MLNRIWIYLKEMYPPLQRLGVAVLVFFEIYYILLLNNGIRPGMPGLQEAVGVFTVFSFLLILRIADDFKDYETDRRLFPERALPSGRVHKKDLAVLLTAVAVSTAILNIVYMNNLPWFIFLYTYGFLMSMWFFQKSKIQPNLFLALITHNPIVMIINLYAISFTTIKYNVPITIYTVLLAFTMYFPGLIWEISRKVRAPEDETEYVTYSSLVGYRKASDYVLILTYLDIVTNLILIWNVNRIGFILLLVNVIWFTGESLKFRKNPKEFRLVDRVERYTMITETIMVVSVLFYLTAGYV